MTTFCFYGIALGVTILRCVRVLKVCPYKFHIPRTIFSMIPILNCKGFVILMGDLQNSISESKNQKKKIGSAFKSVSMLHRLCSWKMKLYIF